MAWINQFYEPQTACLFIAVVLQLVCLIIPVAINQWKLYLIYAFTYVGLQMLLGGLLFLLPEFFLIRKPESFQVHFLLFVFLFFLSLLRVVRLVPLEHTVVVSHSASREEKIKFSGFASPEWFRDQESAEGEESSEPLGLMRERLVRKKLEKSSEF